MRLIISLLLSAAASGGLIACADLPTPGARRAALPTAPQVTAPAAAQAPAPRPRYSPFGVVGADLTVSFKDVGLRVRSAHRAGVLEAIAGGVAFALSAEAVHRPDWVERSWHRQCRRTHIYVDLWRSTHPDRLGYSLWRGCGADDKVDHAELATRPQAFESADGLDTASGLGEAIGAAIGRCVAQARC